MKLDAPNHLHYNFSLLHCHKQLDNRNNTVPSRSTPEQPYLQRSIVPKKNKVVNRNSSLNVGTCIHPRSYATLHDCITSRIHSFSTSHQKVKTVPHHMAPLHSAALRRGDSQCPPGEHHPHRRAPKDFCQFEPRPPPVTVGSCCH